jgi:hypothetical protein
MICKARDVHRAAENARWLGRWFWTTVSLCVGVFAAASADSAVTNRLEQGRLVTQRAAGILSSNLLAALARGGPTNALEFCHVQAIALTEGSGQPGVQVRRVSHRPRNPANRATTNELAVLGQFRDRLKPGAGLPPVLVTNATGQVTFYSAIVLNTPLCLQCHGQAGTEISAGTQEVLRRLYPKDEATGFKLGELRGLWRVNFKPEQ